MKILNILLIGLIALLCITAGAAKVMRLSEEMVFLQGFGFDANMVTIFGIIQLSGGSMLLNRKLRTYGGVLALSAFSLSSLLLFLDGNLTFALLSLLPVIFTIVLIVQSIKINRRKTM
jgi:hypothetical protein